MNRSLSHSLHVAVIAIAGLLGSLEANAATRNFTLYMTEADKTIYIPLATTTYTRTFWVEGFSEVAGRPPEIGGVKLWANEGDTINLTVYNNTAESHGFAITNSVLTNVAPIAAGTNRAFSFAAPTAGSYIYYDPSIDAQTTVANRAAGMYGALIIYPAGLRPSTDTDPVPGKLWVGGPSYKYDYTWVLTDFDKRTNAADKAGTAAPTPYKATYAFINGDFGVHAMKNATVSPVVTVGTKLAIRIVNAGMIAHPIHFHGYHGSVVAVNNAPQTRVFEKDVIDVPAMTTMDVTFDINQKGIYIIHDHTGMMVTQDGIYAEGMLAEFDACKKEGGLIANDPFCPIPTIGSRSWGGTTF